MNKYRYDFDTDAGEAEHPDPSPADYKPRLGLNPRIVRRIKRKRARAQIRLKNASKCCSPKLILLICYACIVLMLTFLLIQSAVHTENGKNVDVESLNSTNSTF